LSKIYKNYLEIIDFIGGLMGDEVLSRRLIFRVDGGNIEK